jgi:hypothetical protein
MSDVAIRARAHTPRIRLAVPSSRRTLQAACFWPSSGTSSL